MKNIYGKIIWKALNEYGVWQPGSDIRLGDYGTIAGGCFDRRGNIYVETQSDPQSTIEATLDNLMIVSEGGVQSDFSASKDNIGAIEFCFENKAGAVFIADGIEAASISDLAALNLLIDGLERWKSNYRIVTSVRRCSHFALFVTNTKGGKLKLSAKLELLSAFLEGQCSLSNQIKVTGASGLSLIGSNGAVSIQAHKRTLWGHDLKRLTPNSSGDREEILVPYIDAVEDT